MRNFGEKFPKSPKMVYYKISFRKAKSPYRNLVNSESAGVEKKYYFASLPRLMQAAACNGANCTKYRLRLLFNVHNLN